MEFGIGIFLIHFRNSIVNTLQGFFKVLVCCAIILYLIFSRLEFGLEFGFGHQSKENVILFERTPQQQGFLSIS